MKIKLSDIESIKMSAKIYSVYLFNRDICISDHDVKAIEEWLRREQKKCPWISWFVGKSTTESSLAFSQKLKTGRKGRPRSVMMGKRCKLHLHIGLIGNEDKSANSSAERLKLYLNKKYKRSVSKIVPKFGAEYIAYSYCQSDSFHKGGEFDFLSYKDDWYLYC